MRQPLRNIFFAEVFIVVGLGIASPVLADEVEDRVASFPFGRHDKVPLGKIAQQTINFDDYIVEQTDALVAIRILGRAVLEDRRDWIARQIVYPTVYGIEGRLEIAWTQQQFLRHYDQIVTPRIRYLLETLETPFTNWSGTVIGRGDVAAFVTTDPRWHSKTADRPRCVYYPVELSYYQFIIQDQAQSGLRNLLTKDAKPLAKSTEKHNAHILKRAEPFFGLGTDPLWKFRC